MSTRKIDLQERAKAAAAMANTIEDDPLGVLASPWQALRSLTPARIALGRTGVSLPTAANLAFQLAHAQARDAVHLPLDESALLADLTQTGVLHPAAGLPPEAPLLLSSAATNRACYLQRPDLGRRLDEASLAQLSPTRGAGAAGAAGAASEGVISGGPDLAIVLADGLSALALQQQAPSLLAALLPRLAADGWFLARLTIVRHARVAIGDEIGVLLRARMVAVLIGERPGLSSPDSLGIYLTWQPAIGTPDSRRNCISNVRAAGLAPIQAAERLHYLLDQARRRQVSGVLLKDESDTAPAIGHSAAFLLGR